MKLEKDMFRIDLRSAKLCIELDCNTIFDASMYRHCPTCGSVEFYPLESWLNRERVQRPARTGFGDDTASILKPTPRPRWLDRLRGPGRDGDHVTSPVTIPLRAQRRHAG